MCGDPKSLTQRDLRPVSSHTDMKTAQVSHADISLYNLQPGEVTHTHISPLGSLNNDTQQNPQDIQKCICAGLTK